METPTAAPADKKPSGLSGLASELVGGDRPLPSFLRFGGVGVLATLIHGSVLHLLVVITAIHPTIANTGAFFVSVGVSYLGHYYFSFRSSARHGPAIAKFLGVAGMGLGLNLVIFGVSVSLLGWHHMIAFGLVVLIVPPAIYLCTKHFVFLSPQDGVAGKGDD